MEKIDGKPRDPETEKHKAWYEDCNELIVELQHQINAAGGVPADIPLTARLDCLIKQRDGQIDRGPRPYPFGRLSTEELGY